MKRIIEIEENDYELSKADKIPSLGIECRRILVAVRDSKPYNPTGDLISREALKKEIQKCEEEPEYQHEEETWQNGLYMAETLIDNAPTVEPERPQGEWKLVERDNQDIDVVCPFCNRTRFPAYSHGYTLEELEEYLIRQHLPKFCEDCGAELKGDAK